MSNIAGDLVFAARIPVLHFNTFHFNSPDDLFDS